MIAQEDPSRPVPLPRITISAGCSTKGNYRVNRSGHILVGNPHTESRGAVSIFNAFSLGLGTAAQGVARMSVKEKKRKKKGMSWKTRRQNPGEP